MRNATGADRCGFNGRDARALLLERVVSLRAIRLRIVCCKKPANFHCTDCQCRRRLGVGRVAVTVHSRGGRESWRDSSSRRTIA